MKDKEIEELIKKHNDNEMDFLIERFNEGIENLKLRKKLGDYYNIEYTKKEIIWSFKQVVLKHKEDFDDEEVSDTEKMGQ